MLCLVTQLCLTLCDPMDCSPLGSSVHGDSPGKNTGGGCHALLQGLLPTQGSNPGLPHCRRILYQLSHKGSPGDLISHECAVPQVSPIRWGLYLAGKESACNVGDLGSIPGLGRSPGEGKDYPLQYSGLEKYTNCIVHGAAELDTTE